MRFLSYHSIQKKEVETEIRNAEINTPRTFIQTWVPDYLMRSLRDPKFKYALFEWDKILTYSFTVGSKFRCFAASAITRLEGLLCLSFEKELKIEFIATAPWNYSPMGIMRRIGSGLIHYVIVNSYYLGHNGEFLLNALPDAEPFYENIGMVATGNVNERRLREYRMSKENADLFQDNFKGYVLKEE
jgi:hypothetical protein